MSTNLIDRLRSLARFEHSDLSIGTEAADEIERLGYLNTAVDKLTERRDALISELERLRDLLRVEQELALRRDPFRCNQIECEWYGRTVRAGHCQCHHEQATEHRAAVRHALETPK